jgi:penicillin-binding protein 1C
MPKFNFKNVFVISFILLIFIFLIIAYSSQKKLVEIYESQNSIVIKDRNGEIISILPNKKGYRASYIDEIPPELKEFLIKKEDKYFYYHFGFNPFSIFQVGLAKLGIGNRKGSSTITQQLVKILLGKETERSLKNKFLEFFYAISLEIFKSKEEILKMYANSIYFGNQVQGIKEAGRFYFGVSPEFLTEGQILQLLATISSPTETNPGEFVNKKIALNLAKKLNLDTKELAMEDLSSVKENMENYLNEDLSFEIQPLLENLKSNQLTIDKDLTEKLREIIQRNLEYLQFKNAKNSALIVIKLPENEILALIGSPDPKSLKEGYQINMLMKPRPIGSTIKPFIYLKAFEKGLRPYTLVEDREYKYITALGFPLYPKNFDYKYRGEVNLHYALSNSLNVPAVKVLEFVGLEDFYDFLEKDLGFKPVQDLNNYQLGIALGVLEMNLMDLAKYFTIFPNNGILKELKISLNQKTTEREIAKPEYIQLVNKILNDRKTGIEQFGLKSELNLFQENYALKTGTSRDFKDSWVIGYTPDFLIGVWVGNTENLPMDEISGQLGAGRIWSEAMELLFNSQYNRKTPFDFSLVKEYNYNDSLEFGLANDNFDESLEMLKKEEGSLILTPHEGDTFLLEDSQIILKSKENVKWFVNGDFLGQGEEVIFVPAKEGIYQIEAKSQNGLEEKINILVNE